MRTAAKKHQALMEPEAGSADAVPPEGLPRWVVPALAVADGHPLTLAEHSSSVVYALLVGLGAAAHAEEPVLVP